MIIEWSPPFTPHNLLQEQYWPDRWKVAIICMFLNCTRRVTAEPIVHEFFRRYPTPEEYACSYLVPWEHARVVELLRPTGFKNRRAENIFKFSIDTMADLPFRDRHGIGAYADACDKMFFAREFDGSPPSDGVLAKVWRWIVLEGGRKHEPFAV